MRDGGIVEIIIIKAKTVSEHTTFKFTIILFFVPPKFCISIVFNFSWDLKQVKNNAYANFWREKKSIMVNMKLAYCRTVSTVLAEVVAFCRRISGIV